MAGPRRGHWPRGWCSRSHLAVLALTWVGVSRVSKAQRDSVQQEQAQLAASEADLDELVRGFQRSL